MQIPENQAGTSEAQLDPDYSAGQSNVSVPYLPQCKYRFQFSIPASSHLFFIVVRPDIDSFPFRISDHFPWDASLGSITFG